MGCGGDNNGIEGTYEEVDSPGLTLTIKDGTWRRGDREIYAEATYTLEELGENEWKAFLTYKNPDFVGLRETMILRRKGEFLFAKEDGSDREVKFRRR